MSEICAVTRSSGANKARLVMFLAPRVSRGLLTLQFIDQAEAWLLGGVLTKPTYFSRSNEVKPISASSGGSIENSVHGSAWCVVHY
ncbi:hypothetical protein CEXT_234061 [Caerostris extrusa]|uniref:Uncharacterized protein n=1 Tax=Caerostris extrusa TaxID=172846 RepID=A0AAV4X1M8_CAEEX|nr:hypothetical protein CEXT_234061 [Caerostris extrusa]